MTQINVFLTAILVACALSLVTSQYQERRLFVELERGMIGERVMAGLARVRAEGKKKLGRPRVGTKVEDVV